MTLQMVNVLEFAHVVELLDRVASPFVVDRALRSAGLDRKVLRQGPGFLPYRAEAEVIERVARALGDPHLGARIAQAFDYPAYDAYAQYVLGARDLRAAISRGRRAFGLIHCGSEIVLERREGHLLVARRTDLRTVVGHRHLDDGALLLIAQVVRHFHGPDWRPAWIEVAGHDAAGAAYLEEVMGAPARLGSPMPALAVREDDLAAQNPSPPGAHLVVGLTELPSLMGVQPPKTTADAVRQVLQTQIALGDLSEEGVASRLSMGRRTLQRALMAEATSFREVKSRFLEARARTLLTESELDVVTIARALGYKEPRSFLRAFRRWTGFWPSGYRARFSATRLP